MSIWPPQYIYDYPLSSSQPPHPTEYETKDFRSHPDAPGPSQDAPSPAESEAQDFLGQLSSGPSPLSKSGPSHLLEPGTKDLIGQVGHVRPPLPDPRQSHLPELKTNNIPSQWAITSPEPEVKDFLGLFFSGKLKRRNSGSGVANSTYSNRRRPLTRPYVFASPTGQRSTTVVQPVAINWSIQLRVVGSRSEETM